MRSREDDVMTTWMLVFSNNIPNTAQYGFGDCSPRTNPISAVVQADSTTRPNAVKRFSPT